MVSGSNTATMIPWIYPTWALRGFERKWGVGIVIDFFIFVVGQAAFSVAGWRPCIDGKEAAMCKEAWVVQVCKGWDWFGLVEQMKEGMCVRKRSSFVS